MEEYVFFYDFIFESLDLIFEALDLQGLLKPRDWLEDLFLHTGIVEYKN